MAGWRRRQRTRPAVRPMQQEPNEKRRLLNFMVSNCTWKNGELQAAYRQPFDMLDNSAKEWAERRTAVGAAAGLEANWLPGQDSNLRPSD